MRSGFTSATTPTIWGHAPVVLIDHQAPPMGLAWGQSGGPGLGHDDDGRRLAGVGVGEDAPRTSGIRMVRKYAQVTDRSNPMGRCSERRRGAAIHGEIHPTPGPSAAGHSRRPRARTPGNAATRPSPAGRRRFAGRARHSATRQRQTQGQQGRGWKPGSADRSLTKVRISSPAPMSTTTASAHFHDHKHAAQPASGARGGVPPRPTVCNAVLRIGAGALDGAGAMQIRMPVASATASAKQKQAGVDSGLRPGDRRLHLVAIPYCWERGPGGHYLPLAPRPGARPHDGAPHE